MNVCLCDKCDVNGNRNEWNGWKRLLRRKIIELALCRYTRNRYMDRHTHTQSHLLVHEPTLMYCMCRYACIRLSQFSIYFVLFLRFIRDCSMLYILDRVQLIVHTSHRCSWHRPKSNKHIYACVCIQLFKFQSHSHSQSFLIFSPFEIWTFALTLRLGFFHSRFLFLFSLWMWNVFCAMKCDRVFFPLSVFISFLLLHQSTDWPPARPPDRSSNFLIMCAIFFFCFSYLVFIFVVFHRYTKKNL